MAAGAVTLSTNSAVAPLLVARIWYSPGVSAENWAELPVADQSGFWGQDQLTSPEAFSTVAVRVVAWPAGMDWTPDTDTRVAGRSTVTVTSLEA